MMGMMMTLLLSANATGADGAEILNDLKRVSVLGTVLYVAAHPDDENTRLLATLAKETKVRAAYLSFTRGEGGQNLIGSELGPLLGVIRTQELLAARRVDGAEQYFTRARDFGYSKSVDETLAIWDHDRVLADAVWIIRSLRPDVIVTRFSPDQKDTHGHHTASARLALEAFTAAADPKFHPEQLDRVQVWQAKRIVWNAWSRDPAMVLPAGTLQWDSSLFSPLLGYSYGELAALSRSMHKSQGFGAAPIHDASPENFAPLAGEQATRTIFDGLDLSWKRVPGSEKFAALLTRAIAEYEVEAPASSIPTLLLALEELRRLPANPWKEQKTTELIEVIANAAGLFVEASSPSTSVVPGGALKLSVFVLNRSSAKLQLEEVKVLTASSKPNAALERGKAWKADLTVEVPAQLPASNPYFLEQVPTRGSWTMAEDQPIGPPELSSPFLVEYRFTAGTQTFSLRRPASFKWTDPTVGERYRPIEVLPPVVVKPNAELLAFTELNAKPLEVTVTANADAQSGQVKLQLPEGFVSEPASAPFTLEKKGQEAKLLFKVKPSSKSAASTSALTVVATIGTSTHTRSLTRLEYGHIPIQTVLSPAQVKLVRIDLRRGKTSKVGYIAGAGDDVAPALRQVGYDVTFLSDEALRSESLSRYDAIVVGIRAYNVNPRLPAFTERLMQYVKDGGTVVAQYNTKNWLSSVPAQLGPFPFEISQDRVTDEEAAMHFEKHAITLRPNALTDADFSGWVQERGLYFGTKWDPRYETPLTMNDPNESPSKGSLLIAKHGKGRFVYTGLSFFRQLPAGVPGAYRLFANLLDHGT
jgi:LmbE family N-acetylglucosaminyl deacetylase